ncbi:PLC-like phosphodiesterase [Hypoxylon sp. FL0543]|nr:PLC-like phosphodiesterase [Hypoxylon sp. FL0543]
MKMIRNCYILYGLDLLLPIKAVRDKFVWPVRWRQRIRSIDDSIVILLPGTQTSNKATLRLFATCPLVRLLNNRDFRLIPSFQDVSPSCLRIEQYSATTTTIIAYYTTSYAPYNIVRAEALTPHLSKSAMLMESTPPAAPWAARLDTKSGPMPQAIAHRGNMSAFPENTMAAFRSAVEVGAHAIETDLHLSKDGVIVISHDATLMRCFGKASKVAHCDWAELSSLRTLREPRQPMPRLVDLLEYLGQLEQEHIWILLDIKMDDDAATLLTKLAETLASVPTTRPWNERIILGCWEANYVALSLKILPGFPLAFQGWSVSYTSAIMQVPNLNLDMLCHTLATRSGSRLIPEARRLDRLIFSWTIKEDEWMELSIRQGLDGVVTDDPKRFLELCSQWPKTQVRNRFTKRAAKQTAQWALICFLVLIAETVNFFVKGSPRSRVKKELGI